MIDQDTLAEGDRVKICPSCGKSRRNGVETKCDRCKDFTPKHELTFFEGESQGKRWHGEYCVQCYAYITGGDIWWDF